MDRLLNWVGPEAAPDAMPTLEIVHHGQDRATLLAASWGPERLLTPQSLHSSIRLSNAGKATYDIVHIAGLSTPQRQLDFLQSLRNEPIDSAISIGTYARAIGTDRKTVQLLLNQSDVFFMNANEAALLLDGRPIVPAQGQLIFVTDGKEGATTYYRNLNEHQSMDNSADGTAENTSDSTAGNARDCMALLVHHIRASQANEVDPTGAGDTFCGATLARLPRQPYDIQNILSAARFGSEVAARIIEGPGSSYYF